MFNQNCHTKVNVFYISSHQICVFLLLKSGKTHEKNYDSKNMMHTIRLLQVADEIIRTGNLNLKRNNREQLLDIKSGKIEYDTLLKMADDLMSSIENNAKSCHLQESPDTVVIEEALVEIRKKIYQ